MLKVLLSKKTLSLVSVDGLTLYSRTLLQNLVKLNSVLSPPFVSLSEAEQFFVVDFTICYYHPIPLKNMSAHLLSQNADLPFAFAFLFFFPQRENVMNTQYFFMYWLCSCQSIEQNQQTYVS